MTASGRCHICSKKAFSFHYRRPLKEAGFHDGFWHCAEHGPTVVETINEERKNNPTFGMSRAERRALRTTNKRRW